MLITEARQFVIETIKKSRRSASVVAVSIPEWSREIVREALSEVGAVRGEDGAYRGDGWACTGV